MASVNASMEQYYAARAACYDAVYNRPERQDDILATKALLAQRCAGKSVLEIAAGTGYPGNRSWTRPSGLRWGALARRDDAAGS